MAVVGSLKMPCKIAGSKMVVHEFIVAENIEFGLIVLNFIKKHKAVWD